MNYEHKLVVSGGPKIDITVTDKAEMINKWVAEIMPRYVYNGESTVVGLDMEWRPPQYSTMTNKTATLSAFR